MLNDFYNFLLLFIFSKINSGIKLIGRKYFFTMKCTNIKICLCINNFFSKPKSIFVKYIICISVLQYFLIENFEIILNYQQFLSKLKGIKIIYMNSIQK